MDDSRAALGFDMCAHPVQFGDMHVAVFKYGLRQHAGAVCHAEHRHELGLHIGCKTGIGRS